jgi:hypothetical protein
MSAHYGYFEDTLGADGDELDVFVALGTPHDYDGRVFVISQNDRHGNFDEHKVILGVTKRSSLHSSTVRITMKTLMVLAQLSK